MPPRTANTRYPGLAGPAQPTAQEGAKARARSGWSAHHRLGAVDALKDVALCFLDGTHGDGSVLEFSLLSHTVGDASLTLGRVEWQALAL